MTATGIVYMSSNAICAEEENIERLHGRSKKLVEEEGGSSFLKVWM